MHKFLGGTNNDYINSGVVLDNNDIILSTNEYIYIYKLINNGYNLFQTIFEKEQYKSKFFQLGDIWEYHYLNYRLIYVKQLNKTNRFMSISTYVFKIYDINENINSIYSCIFTYVCDETNKEKILQNAYEINDKEFILINKRIYNNHVKEENHIYREKEFVLEKLDIKTMKSMKG